MEDTSRAREHATRNGLFRACLFFLGSIFQIQCLRIAAWILFFPSILAAHVSPLRGRPSAHGQDDWVVGISRGCEAIIAGPLAVSPMLCIHSELGP